MLIVTSTGSGFDLGVKPLGVSLRELERNPTMDVSSIVPWARVLV